ncbi:MULTISPECIES: patatin-like phospholipase family protein [Pseudomonadota]|uniref:patatin-like phospholipase family protein n=1 Tax=Pseudomonadota TaxID=1224 RepID=UPI0032658CE0
MKQYQISLALSGGGVRAMVFHLGVLRALAEDGLLESIKRISTVSGGSLLTGLLFEKSELSWPSSDKFLKDIHPELRALLCSRSLLWDSIKQLNEPENLQYVFSRSNLLAKALQNNWSIKSLISSLPEVPEWSINGTNAENGRRFRFKKVNMGDYRTGYAVPERLPLAFAMAVSAAFPVGFGPLVMRTDEFTWHKRTSWNQDEAEARKIVPEYKKIHLYDGGVYDNLGLESFFDSGNNSPKHEDCFIIASNAGAPLSKEFARFSLNPFRLKRVIDIISDQSRALRTRAFQNYIENFSAGGISLTILPGTNFGQDNGLNSKFAARYPTNLNRITYSHFDGIEDHGYQVARKAFDLHKMKVS